MLGKYLLATNTISCGLMMTTGDLIQQSSEYWKCFSNKYFSSGIMAASIDKDEKMSSCEYDYTRMKNMTIIGLLQGPFHHWFYMTLDRVLPDKNARSIVKKIFLDQSIASPTCLGIFYVGLGILERDKIEKICQELKVKFMTTWKVRVIRNCIRYSIFFTIIKNIIILNINSSLHFLLK